MRECGPDRRLTARSAFPVDNPWRKAPQATGVPDSTRIRQSHGPAQKILHESAAARTRQKRAAGRSSRKPREKHRKPRQHAVRRSPAVLRFPPAGGNRFPSNLRQRATFRISPYRRHRDIRAGRRHFHGKLGKKTRRIAIFAAQSLSLCPLRYDIPCPAARSHCGGSTRTQPVSPRFVPGRKTHGPGRWLRSAVAANGSHGMPRCTRKPLPRKRSIGRPERRPCEAESISPSATPADTPR